MNKKILASIFVIGILALAMGWGTISYYSDTETSTGNVFQSGTIDLILFGDIPFAFYDIKPSEELAPVTVSFQNIGQNPGYLYNKITYIENDKAEVPESDAGDLSADDFAALIYVKAVTYEHYTLAGGWSGVIRNDLPNWLSMDLNKDGYVSLYEMNQCDWLPYDEHDPEEPLLAGDGGRWVITFHMADSLTAYPDGALEFDVEDNWPQADGIDMTWTAVLNQLPETPP
jgi:predicted ribosomally synthesized peptide with SipW-like signal peptide